MLAASLSRAGRADRWRASGVRVFGSQIRTALGDLGYPKLITNPLAPTESAGFRIPGPRRQMRPTMASDRQLEVDRPRQKQDRLASAHPLRLNRSGD